ncbi:MAG: phosphatidylglycerophosphatase A, partial [bacterium]
LPLFTVCFFPVRSGNLAAGKAEVIFEEPDSSKIVLDEIVGYLVAMFLVPKTFWFAFMGFFIFRMFDIIKPKPINQFDETGGGFSVMFDDVLAGLYTNICLQILALLFT